MYSRQIRSWIRWTGSIRKRMPRQPNAEPWIALWRWEVVYYYDLPALSRGTWNISRRAALTRAVLAPDSLDRVLTGRFPCSKSYLFSSLARTNVSPVSTCMRPSGFVPKRGSWNVQLKPPAKGRTVWSTLRYESTRNLAAYYVFFFVRSFRIHYIYPFRRFITWDFLVCEFCLFSAT